MQAVFHWNNCYRLLNEHTKDENSLPRPRSLNSHDDVQRKPLPCLSSQTLLSNLFKICSTSSFATSGFGLNNASTTEPKLSLGINE
mmetsp:Transcript_20677/g.44693  ORF Transcript_20677/g.44693 Transcript_20677/m.44693 type:complete len:86 (+) Transcript_20677:1621-1878(+)